MESLVSKETTGTPFPWAWEILSSTLAHAIRRYVQLAGTVGNVSTVDQSVQQGIMLLSSPKFNL